MLSLISTRGRHVKMRGSGGSSGEAEGLATNPVWPRAVMAAIGVVRRSLPTYGVSCQARKTLEKTASSSGARSHAQRRPSRFFSASAALDVAGPLDVFAEANGFVRRRGLRNHAGQRRRRAGRASNGTRMLADLTCDQRSAL